MDLLVWILGGVISISLLYVVLRFVRRLFSKILTKTQMFLLDFVVVLFVLAMFLAVVSPAAQLHHLFYLTLVLLIVAVGVLVLGTRRILEQYFTGVFVTRVLDLHVGDYVEFNKLKGYITSLGDTYIVIKDPRREYIYIPYSVLLQEPFRRVKSPEGHEVRVKLFIPLGHDLKKIREVVKEVASAFGLEKLSVDVEKIGLKGVVVVARGVLKDPRREDELKYAILDRVYAEFSKRLL
ncbi:MAG: mechanosensitive ion channel [Pyrobaculum sp.]